MLLGNKFFGLADRLGVLRWCYWWTCGEKKKVGEEKEGVCLFILVFGVDSINDAQRWRVRKAAEDVRVRATV